MAQNQHNVEVETEDGKKVRRLEAALARAQAEAEASLDMYREVVESRSWRLTGPLRRLMVFLRRMRVVPEPASSIEVKIDAAAGVEGLPSSLRILPADDLKSANATCKQIDLSPELESIVSDRVRALLDDTETDGADIYLGWHAGPECVAFIGSHELRCELAFDARISEVADEDWKTTLTPGKHRFLLVETVWEACNRQWRYKLARDGGSRERFEELVAHCRSISLPVVVWFRETPDHYPQFAWLAELADHTYVSDEELLQRFRRDFPGREISMLAPAIQPAMHNPLRSYGLMDASKAFEHRILFDGWWDLQAGAAGSPQLEALKQHGLLVSESEWDFGAVRLGDVPEFQKFTIGCLSRQERLTANRLFGAQVFLGEPLSGAWRTETAMLRVAASGGLVARLDGAAAPLPELQLPGAEGRQPSECLPSLLSDPIARAAWSHRAWRSLASHHTIGHRLQRIADDLSLEIRFLPKQERIACLLVTMRPDLLAGCIERFRRDAYPYKELIVVVNRDDCSPADFDGLAHGDEPIRIFVAGRCRSLGACLNFALSRTDAPFWAKVDDDDLYGPNYLSDMMLYQRAGPFKVFGKPPVFGYLESGDELLWDSEWARHVNLVHDAGRARAALVAGGTLSGCRSILDVVSFSERRRGGSDSDFIRRCYEQGFDVAALDGFNFVRFRSDKTGFHTWNLPEEEVRLRSIPAGSRDDIKHVAFI